MMKKDVFSSRNFDILETEFNSWLDSKKGSIMDLTRHDYNENGVYYIEVTYTALGYKLKTKFN